MVGTKYNYRLVITMENGRSIKLAGSNCHQLKSLAGSEFHRPKVKSVFVGDILGNHFLYLVKNHPEKKENVPSALAQF